MKKKMQHTHLRTIFNQMADDSPHEVLNQKDLELLSFWPMGYLRLLKYLFITERNHEGLKWMA